MSDVGVTSEAIGGLWIALMFTVIILQDRRLSADHARIVSEKDAEIRRLRAALTLAEHKIDQYLQGQYPDGVSLRSTVAAIRAALNPYAPAEPKGAANEHHH